MHQHRRREGVPRKVEETLKTHAACDANVVGVPDDKWGQAVVAVVSFEPGASAATADPSHTAETLAGSRCQAVEVVDVVRRGPNGKADYRWAASVASSVKRAALVVAALLATACSGSDATKAPA